MGKGGVERGIVCVINAGISLLSGKILKDCVA